MNFNIVQWYRGYLYLLCSCVVQLLTTVHRCTWMWCIYCTFTSVLCIWAHRKPKQKRKLYFFFFNFVFFFFVRSYCSLVLTLMILALSVWVRSVRACALPLQKITHSAIFLLCKYENRFSVCAWYGLCNKQQLLSFSLAPFSFYLFRSVYRLHTHPIPLSLDSAHNRTDIHSILFFLVFFFGVCSSPIFFVCFFFRLVSRISFSLDSPTPHHIVLSIFIHA